MTALGLPVVAAHVGLERDLRAVVRGEVRFDAGTRAVYSTDASNFRRTPIGVVLPRTPEDAVAAIEVCRAHAVPVLSRGGGTSLAGQCCNVAVVLDWSKYCDRLISVDAAARTAVVEPGIVLDRLDELLEPYGLMVGPRPSTHVSCTIGGMIGNNSCGSTAQAYGTMADSVRRLEILTYEGLRAWVGEHDDWVARDTPLGELVAGLLDLRDRYADRIRQHYPDLPRRVSGYNLDALLPENGFQLARLLVGSESTLVTVLRAEIDLVPRPRAEAMAVLGFPDIYAAADAVPTVVAHGPAALEGIDQRLMSLEHSRHLAEQAIRQLPDGQGWLVARFHGADQDEANRAARTMITEACQRADVTATLLEDPVRQDEIWAAREAGLGATAYPPDGPETHEGWEDAAVPPARLGDYLREFDALLREFGYGSASLYGHFGQGCVHTRIPFQLRTAEGIAHYREFLDRAARLVVDYGGSLSGEHGDGRTRGPLLPIMFGADLVSAFAELKALFDPRGKMNPGVVVDPEGPTQGLRQGSDYRPWEPRTYFAFPHDGHRFSEAAGRCVGVGKCRGEQSGVMCPSYRVTREERHSTRGRARLLFEMLNGGTPNRGWRSTEVRDALDLCLSCKGCRSDCPVDVDMATYKAEFLAHFYRRRLRPRSHYSMGWIPLWARLGTAVSGIANTVTHTGGLDRLVQYAGGVATQRQLPRFAGTRFQQSFRRRTTEPRRTRGTVVLWPDTFTNNFEPGIAHDAVAVLEDAGFQVCVPSPTVCCGLTWISTGQLATAQRVLRRTLRVLRPALRAGLPIVVLEPSCAAVFRADLPELLYGDEDAHRLAAQTYTLAEVLTGRADDWQVPRLAQTVLAQPHCHHHAILGYGPDRDLLTATGASVTVLDAGCCGMAGNFGFEADHYEISVACAEDKLMPAVRDRSPGTVVLADGFSCRTQIGELEPGCVPTHSARLLAAGLEKGR